MRDMLSIAAPPLPPLKGPIVNTPVLTEDGILAQPGYDSASGLYLDLNVRVPPVPTAPSEADIEEARRIWLDDLLVDFPFAGEADKCHAVALALTVVARPAIAGPTPLFLWEASDPGSGKGLGVDAIAMVTTGSPAVSVSEAHGEDEWRKRITSLLLHRKPLVRIDNLTRKVDSANLASALTDLEWTDRMMGRGQMVTVPVRMAWAATGNNPTLSDEMARRVVRTRLVPGVERPWTREEFRHDPLLAWVRQERPRLLWGLLVMVAAWVANGRPPGRYRRGSYEAWAETVGGILDAAGITGFLGNSDEVDAEAVAEKLEWSELVIAWADAYGSQRVGVGKLFDLAREREVLVELRTGRKDSAARTMMGQRLRELRDRVIAGYQIKLDGSHGGALQYRLYLPQGTAEPHRGSPSSPIQVSLGELGDPLPHTEPGPRGASTPACGHDDSFMYTPSGELYCSRCDPQKGGAQ